MSFLDRRAFPKCLRASFVFSHAEVMKLSSSLGAESEHLQRR